MIDQYQVSTDKRSGITNDPNRPDDPEYIVRLLGQVITVSLETVKVVKGVAAAGTANSILKGLCHSAQRWTAGGKGAAVLRWGNIEEGPQP